MHDQRPDEAVPLEDEETLDPQDWEAMRVLGRRMVDDMLAYLESIRERAVWQPIPEAVKQNFRLPLPMDPQKLEAIYQEFLEPVLKLEQVVD